MQCLRIAFLFITLTTCISNYIIRNVPPNLQMIYQQLACNVPIHLHIVNSRNAIRKHCISYHIDSHPKFSWSCFCFILQGSKCIRYKKLSTSFVINCLIRTIKYPILTAKNTNRKTKCRSSCLTPTEINCLLGRPN
jgi:hypothetical protein